MELLKYFRLGWLDFCKLEFFTKLKLRDFSTIESKKIPVVLVQGSLASARYMIPFKRFLESRNYPVYLYSRKRNTKYLSELSDQLMKRVSCLKEKRIQIVAHSLGGLITLWAMQNKKFAKKVQQVIAVGSPFKGSLWGALAFYDKNKKFLKYFSKDTQKLTSNKKINSKFVSLFAEYDEFVIPQSCAHLNDARGNFQIPVVGHYNIIRSKEGWKEIESRLV